MLWSWLTRHLLLGRKLKPHIVFTVAFVLTACGQEAPTGGSNAVSAVKLSVSDNGFYQIGEKQLRQAGLNFEELVTDNFRLSTGDSSVDYWLTEDYIIFYGQGPTSRYSPSRSYLLEMGKLGSEMSIHSVMPNENVASIALDQVRHFEKNLIYDGQSAHDQKNLLGSDDPWFWETIQAQSELKIDIELPELKRLPAVIRLGMWGVTQDQSIEPDHDFDLLINGAKVGSVAWDGESYHVANLSINPGILLSGSNEIVLDNSNDGNAALDIMRLDWIEVEYQATESQTTDPYRLPSVGGIVELSVASKQSLLFDVGNPLRPTILTDWAYQDGKVRLQADSDLALRVVDGNDLIIPDEILALTENSLSNDTSQADLIIITTEELAPELTPLMEARVKQGLSVKVVTVEDIYDEMAFGELGPGAINGFLRNAYNSWKRPKPGYLLLVGESTYDYRDYLGHAANNNVPSPMVSVNYGGETVSDARLADINDDLFPDFAVGRWPVSTSEEVRSLVNRTLAYEQSSANREAVFVADGSSMEFQALNQTLVTESGLDASSAKFFEGIDSDQFSDIWHGSPWLVTYTGHGSLNEWGKEENISGDSIKSLSLRNSPPIMLQMTCLTGFFAHPTQESISEKMLTNEEGPVLIISATSLTLSTNQQPFGIGLISELQNHQNARIGDAIQNAKQSLDRSSYPGLQEIVDTFGLLGDPSAMIVRPNTTGH